MLLVEGWFKCADSGPAYVAHVASRVGRVRHVVLQSVWCWGRSFVAMLERAGCALAADLHGGHDFSNKIHLTGGEDVAETWKALRHEATYTADDHPRNKPVRCNWWKFIDHVAVEVVYRSGRAPRIEVGAKRSNLKHLSHR